MRSNSTLFFKCVVMGDKIFLNGQFLQQELIVSRFHPQLLAQAQESEKRNYEVTILSSACIDGRFKGARYKVLFNCTDEQHDFKNIRALNYPGSNLFIFLFSYEDRDSFANIEYWLSEINDFRKPNIPIFLFGLNSNTNKEEITYQEAELLAKKLNMIFIDCPSLETEILQEKFAELMNKFLIRHFSKRHFSFFETHFKQVDQGLDFAKKAVILTRGYHQKECFLNLLPIELLFMILYHLGKELLRNSNSRDDLLALTDLCRLIYINTFPKQSSKKKVKKWERELIKDKETISIYPPSLQISTPSKKNCLLM